MYLTDEILDKLNSQKNKKTDEEQAAESSEITLSDVMNLSFAELKELTGDKLNWGEKDFLYQQAQNELKENKMAQSRILSRANPQLTNAIRLAIHSSPLKKDYEDIFPQRASQFVRPGSVASMFSPAGYLTELYREAIGLHPEKSVWNLDNRRPDLPSLLLSQKNMDEEVSTLKMSNEILMSSICDRENKNDNEVLQTLSTYRQSGITPYHQLYEAARIAIHLQDPELKIFSDYPYVTIDIDKVSMLAIQSEISPELYNILTENVSHNASEQEIQALIKKNFGDINLSLFQNTAYLAEYYGLPRDEVSSLIGIMTTDTHINDTKPHYQSGQLVSLVAGSDGKIKAILIKQTVKSGSYGIEFAELIPTGVNQYLFNCSMKNSYKPGPLKIGTKGYKSSDIYDNPEYEIKKGVPFSVPATFTEEQQAKGIQINVTTVNGFSPSILFEINSYPFEIFLLKLNKLIRLYKATRISPSDLRAIIESYNQDLAITNQVLEQLFWVSYYMKRYNIDVAAALSLSGAPISQIDHEDYPSHFNRLFNSPPITNKIFYADDAAITLTPEKVHDAFRTGVIKRAFGVNDTELFTLWCLATGKTDPPDFICNITELSLLYRISLLADIHGLSITELSALLSVSAYADEAIGSLSIPEFYDLLGYMDVVIQWLSGMQWSVSDLYMMLTDRYSTEMTVEIENLLTTLKNGQVVQSRDRTNHETLTMIAPFIAAAMQLDSAETASAILQWLDQIKPKGADVQTFLALANKDNRTSEETITLVSFCQVMGQLSLFVRSAELCPTVLSWIVNHPRVLYYKYYSLLPHNLDVLYDLTDLHDLVNRSETHATEIITSLSGNSSKQENNLAVKVVATALDLDERALNQALNKFSSVKYFYNWPILKATLQWVDAANKLGITPDALYKLIRMKYTAASPPSWNDWLAVSQSLQAGLDAQQSTELEARIDEKLSDAISAYTIMNISPSWVTDRDKLYNWLLIDNQVSAQIKTTRIAEAISSVQMYVNRALSTQEEEVNNAVKSRQFFTDWDTYNKHYSTWAGVSKLAYYPENYIDPTIRVGQTSMMDEMLQTLGQSQFNNDTVQDAFNAYMTRFEEIANLDIVSGYHNSVSSQTGKTYLIGRSAIGEYYWRTADLDKLAGGKLPASAWTEWKKVTTAISAFNNLVRPVIFQSRLYITWVESKEVATPSGSSTTNSIEYTLKYAHILHDGNWSAPLTISLDKETIQPGGTAIANIGMYSAQEAEQNKLYIYFYQKQSAYQSMPVNIAGLSLLDDGTVAKIDSSSAAKVAGYIYLQLDTTKAVRLNTPYTGGNTKITLSTPQRAYYRWGDSLYTLIDGSRLSDIKTEIINDQINLTFNATASVSYRGYGPESHRSRILIDMMKAASKQPGDIFYVPSLVRKSKFAISCGRSFECLFKKTGSTYSFYVRVTDNITPATGDNIYMYKSPYATILENSVILSSLFNRLSPLAGSKKSWYINNVKESPGNYIYVLMSPYGQYTFATPNELMYEDFKAVNTAILTRYVTLSAEYGSAPPTKYTAQGNPKLTFDESLFTFTGKTFTVPFNAFQSNTAELRFAFRASAPAGDNRLLGEEVISLKLTRVDESSMPVISLNRTEQGAQYLQYGIYRIRVNTLFAKQLVTRANAGLDAILSMETQLLPEPALGKGTYVTLHLYPYDKSINGSSKEFKVLMCDVYVNGDRHLLASGVLDSEQRTSCSFFLPRLDESTASPTNMYFCIKYQSGETIRMRVSKKNDNWEIAYPTDLSSIKGLESVSGMKDNYEKMDFSGANALYFWEMFYYVPMMVFKRLLSEGKFTEATQWIKYIWNPDGYTVNGEPATWCWNVRPLEEETNWQANPLDSVDPDAIAQADPMHYKLATFMSYLDLLITRGDTAYRQLERETLSEAKMWYVQALNILGDEPYVAFNTSWAAPRLTDAAKQTLQANEQQALQQVRQQHTTGEVRTANSLTNLFLPQQNEKLAGYWQTLSQRLYNLRHNLSIDGTPLSLSIYARPADPATLLSSAVSSSSGSSTLPVAIMPLQRFPKMLENARRLVTQLMQFGNTLLSISERQDAAALARLLKTQGAELRRQSIARQEKSISEIDANQQEQEESYNNALSRLEYYDSLYNENVSPQEIASLALQTGAASITAVSKTLYMGAALAELVPNTFGLAMGGARYGGLLNAGAFITQVGSESSKVAAEILKQSEIWRRRREDWKLQRDKTKSEVAQIEAKLQALAIRREGAVLQKKYMETEQIHTQSEMIFLQNKFTSKELYNWLHGKLAAIYYQFYDLTISSCLMAENAYKWSMNIDQKQQYLFIRTAPWQGAYAGLMTAETLMLNLTQMEQNYQNKEEREKEVTRTVSLTEVYHELSDQAFTLTDQIAVLINAGKGSAGSKDNGLAITADKQFQATIKLSDLNIDKDYPLSLGGTRRIKQISVTLPEINQDVRAVLHYGGSVIMPQGCDAIAVSHGVNDSGQFQLSFSDTRWLPFEGIPVNDNGRLELSFPDAISKQKDLLLNLTDIILHIRYTITK